MTKERTEDGRTAWDDANEEAVRAALSVAFAEPIHIRPRDYLEKVLAGLFGRQPDMSGDQRKRLNSHELASVGRVSDRLMRALIAQAVAARPENRP